MNHSETHTNTTTATTTAKVPSTPPAIAPDDEEPSSVDGELSRAAGEGIIITRKKSFWVSYIKDSCKHNESMTALKLVGFKLLHAGLYTIAVHEQYRNGFRFVKSA